MDDLREQIVQAILEGFRFKHPNQPMNRHRAEAAADKVLSILPTEREPVTAEQAWQEGWTARAEYGGAPPGGGFWKGVNPYTREDGGEDE